MIFTGSIEKAATGLFNGKETLPEERIGIAGFCTFNVAP